MSLAAFAMLVLSASATTGARAASNEFADALTAFRAGDYDKAARALPALADALPKNRDYYLYFLGESQFYAGAYAKARAAFAELGKLHDSHFAGIAPARVADCLWMEGKREEAAEPIASSSATSPPSIGR